MGVPMDRNDFVVLLAAAVIAALLVWTGIASAAPYTLRFQNPGTTAYKSLRTPWGTVAAPCAGGATCSVVIDIPVGPRTITAEATADGSLWSARSNSISVLIPMPPAECIALPACRFDSDFDGFVGGSDFSALIKAFGSTWVP